MILLKLLNLIPRQVYAAVVVALLVALIGMSFSHRFEVHNLNKKLVSAERGLVQIQAERQALFASMAEEEDRLRAETGALEIELLLARTTAEEKLKT